MSDKIDKIIKNISEVASNISPDISKKAPLINNIVSPDSLTKNIVPSSVSGAIGGIISSEKGSQLASVLGDAFKTGAGAKLPLKSDGCWGGDALSGQLSESLSGPLSGKIDSKILKNNFVAGADTGPLSQAASLDSLGGMMSKRLLANEEWFTLEINNGPEVSVYSFEGSEEISKPYDFSIEVISEDNAIKLKEFLGREALLTLADNSGEKRFVHGIIREAKQLHTGNKYTHYRLELVPRLWFLSQNQEHRIFQNKSVLEIIKKILNEQNFYAEFWDFKVEKSYPAREYCLQYGESDLHFISRLCEEEGIYFYFEHTEKYHNLYFSDASGGAPITGENSLRFFPGSGQMSDTAVIARMNLHERINSDASAYKDWNFEKPKLDLFVKKDESSDEKAPVHGGINYERYQYPHLYQEKGDGEKYVDVQLLRQLTWHAWIDGESDVARLTPGFIFTLKEHPRDDNNRQWWLAKVIHKGEQPQVLKHEAPSDRGHSYNASFVAIPDDIRFVPELIHEKKVIIGNQTAIVTGPKGEEIYPDKYGRVKVQFFWDREGKWDEFTTCWIRVSQGWAGGEYGTMAIPRIGHEVIVSFLEGNPDRPIITGRVYHAINKVPYELPAHKTRTVFKSLSSPGGGGFNELRIEDKKGKEEIYLHAEKDVNAYVKNDWKEHILHDKHRTVDNFRYTHIKGEEQVLIEKLRKQELKEEDYLTVHKDSHTEYKTKWLAKAGEEIHLKAGSKVVMEAGADLTIKAGGAFIRLNASGVTIVGAKVLINSGGSPGEGTGVSMQLPEQSIKTDAGTVPKSQILALQQAARKGKPFCAKCQ